MLNNVEMTIYDSRYGFWKDEQVIYLNPSSGERELRSYSKAGFLMSSIPISNPSYSKSGDKTPIVKDGIEKVYFIFGSNMYNGVFYIDSKEVTRAEYLKSKNIKFNNENFVGYRFYIDNKEVTAEEYGKFEKEFIDANVVNNINVIPIPDLGNIIGNYTLTNQKKWNY